MSLGDGSGLSAADIMALANNNDGFGGGAGFGWWIIPFILLLVVAASGESADGVETAAEVMIFPLWLFRTCTAQTQQLIANNQAQTDYLMGFLNPGYARPFYGWAQNPAPTTSTT